MPNVPKISRPFPAQAIHLLKFETAQRDAEARAESTDVDAATSVAGEKKARRERQLERQRDVVQFMNSWMDQGYQHWKTARLRERDRARFDLRYELALLEREEVLETRKHRNASKDGSRGVEWFDRNLRRLGISTEAVSAPTEAASAEPATVYLQRIEAAVAGTVDKPEAAAELMLGLREKGDQNRAARKERERRRRKMVLDQHRAQEELRTKKAEETRLAGFLDFAREQRNISLARWEGTRAEALAADERAKNAAALAARFREGADAAFEAFAEDARERAKDETRVLAIRREVEAQREASRLRKHQRAEAIAKDASSKLVDLVCVVCQIREDMSLEPMPFPKYRSIKERYVSNEPFFQVQEAIELDADKGEQAENAAAEAEAFASDVGAWAASGVSPDERFGRDGRDPALVASGTFAALISSTPPSTRPSPTAFDLPLRACVLGPGAGTAARPVAVARNAVLATVDGACAAAVAANASEPAEDEEVSPEFSALAAAGAQLAKLPDLSGEVPDAVLAEVLAAFLSYETAPGGWVLASFPETTLRAKLLENAFSGYSDPDVDASLKKSGSAKKLPPRLLDDDASDGPSLDVLIVTDEALRVVDNDASAPAPAPAPLDEEVAEQPLDGPMAVAEWWGAKASATFRWPPLQEAMFEERLDAAFEVVGARRDAAAAISDAVAAAPAPAEDAAAPEEADAPPLDDDDDAEAPVLEEEEDDLDASVDRVIADRVAALPAASRIWRAHLTGARRLDLDVVNESLDAWRRDAAEHGDAVHALARALDDQAALVRAERARAYKTYRNGLRSPEPRWDACQAAAVRRMLTRKREVTNADRLTLVDDLELALGDVVDDRLANARARASELEDGARAAARRATELLAVLAGRVASAEAMRFSAGCSALDDYEANVDGEDVVKAPFDAPKRLGRAIASLDARLGDCVSSDVAAKVRGALALAAPLGAGETGRPAKHRAPHTVQLASHLVRRLASLLSRFAAAESRLAATIGGLAGHLADMADQRVRVEHEAVAAHAAMFRAHVKRGDLVVVEVTMPDEDGVELPEA